jgi:hypothetical protein
MTGVQGGVAVPAGAGYVLIGPLGAAYLARAIALIERDHPVRQSENWRVLRESIDRAAAFAYERTNVRPVSDLKCSDRVGTSVRVGAEQVADMAQCSQQWARTLLRRGEFATARRLGSVWTVDKDEVAAWVVARAIRDEAVA